MIEKRQNSVDENVFLFTLDQDHRSRIVFANYNGGFWFDNNGEDVAPPMDY